MECDLEFGSVQQLNTYYVPGTRDIKTKKESNTCSLGTHSLYE